MRNRSLSLLRIFIFFVAASYLVSCVSYNERYTEENCVALEMNISDKKYTYSYKGSDLSIYLNNDTREFSLLTDDIILDLSVGDMDNDGTDEILILSGKEGSKYGKEFIVYKPIFIQDMLTVKKIYSNNLSKIKPWMIEICEIDGDGIKDIFIGAYKSTPYYPKEENRPFFFNFVQGKLVKKWTGSKVRHPFVKVCFIDITGDLNQEFVVVESTENGKNVVAVYNWFGFGFIILGESMEYSHIIDIDVIKIGGKEYILIEIEEEEIKREVILQISEKQTESEIYLLEERGK